MLESKGNRSNISNINQNSLRKPRFGLQGTFFFNIKSLSRRFLGMGKGRIQGTVDEEISKNVPLIDKKDMKDQRTREEIYSAGIFEWVKTERAGETCKFKEISLQEGIEYIVFEDGSRVVSSLVGDVVLLHENEQQVLGASIIPARTDEEILGYVQKPAQSVNQSTGISKDSPVLAILEKSKKRTEKLALTLSVKIPTPELYAVIKENFEDVDSVLLENVLQQIQEVMLREAVKRELLNIYNKRKKQQPV